MKDAAISNFERYWVMLPPKECLCCGQKFNPPLEATAVRIE